MVSRGVGGGGDILKGIYHVITVKVADDTEEEHISNFPLFYSCHLNMIHFLYKKNVHIFLHLNLY